MRALDTTVRATWIATALWLLAVPAQAMGNAHFSVRTEAAQRIADDEGDDDYDLDDEDSDEGSDEPAIFVERFEQDPLGDADPVLAGDPLPLLSWALDAPAWDGDAPGSLTAAYRSNEPAGLFGFALPAELTEDDAFTAVAAFTVHAAGFQATTDAFAQISWGLWNSSVTGLDRSGSPTTTSDVYESIAFDWFPNVTSQFQGPFLSPVAFGVADTADPGFPFAGAIANFSAVFNFTLDLPRDVPLAAVLEHRPDLDVMSVQVLRILPNGAAIPLDAGVVNLALDPLSPRIYTLDTVGLMLWHDGFGGPVPAVEADLTYHALVVAPGVTARPEEWLHVED